MVQEVVVTLPPVAREEEHGVDDKGEGDDEGAIVQFAAVSTRFKHDDVPETVYPVSHVG